MSAKPNFFRLGVFILGGTALLVAALLVFGGGQMFRPRIMAETYISGSVQGVDIGSPVKFRGVLIGKVTRISFVFTEYDVKQTDGLHNYVIVFFEIDREVFPNMFTGNLTPRLEKGIAQGLRIRIEPQGVTGLNYLNIDYVDPRRFPALTPTWKPEYYYIPSAPGQITSLLDSINMILREFEKLNISGITQSSSELLENLNKAVTGAQVGKISQDLQSLIENFNTSLEGAKVPEVSSDIRKFLSDIESSNRALQRVLINIEPASDLSGTQIRQMVDNLAATIANLEQLSQELKSRPSLLLWGSPAKPTATPRPKAAPTPKRR